MGSPGSPAVFLGPPPHLTFPTLLGVPSLTRGPTRGVHSSPRRPCSPSLTRGPSRGPLVTPLLVPVLPGPPKHWQRSASNSAPGMLVAAAPGPRAAGTPAVTLAPALRSHLSAVTRGPGAAASSDSCPESLSCWVLACWAPTRSLASPAPRRAPLSTQDPRCRRGGRCCCPRCGSARGGQSHPTARSAPRPPTRARPSAPPPAAL